MKPITEQGRIESLLYAMASHADLVQWVGGFVAGQNEGGMMVALYGRHGNFPVCKVYSEQFYMLPDYLVNQVPERAAELPKDRNAAERAGRLVSCRPFQIARFRLGDGEKARWRLAGVLRLGKETEESTVPPVPQTAVSTQAPPQSSATELAESFFRVNDQVEVKGSTGNKPGVVTGNTKDRNGNHLVGVKVGKDTFWLAPDKLIPTALA